MQERNTLIDQYEREEKQKALEADKRPTMSHAEWLEYKKSLELEQK